MPLTRPAACRRTRPRRASTSLLGRCCWLTIPLVSTLLSQTKTYMLYLPRFNFVMDDDLSDFVEDADLDDLSSDATLGSRSNSNSHLTADGPGEFWCPVCGQRCTSNLTTGIEYGHALDCPERGSSCADRSQATEARQTCGGGGSDRGRQPRSQHGRKQGLAPDPTGGSAAASRRDLNDSAGRGRFL